MPRLKGFFRSVGNIALCVVEAFFQANRLPHVIMWKVMTFFKVLISGKGLFVAAIAAAMSTKQALLVFGALVLLNLAIGVAGLAVFGLIFGILYLAEFAIAFYEKLSKSRAKRASA